MPSLTPIHDFLTEYANSGTVRCHMPGHKGGENPLDITEIHGADSLYESDLTGDIITQSEQNAARLFGTRKTLYSCSGSTLAINAMLALAKAYGGGKSKVIASRSSHRAFISSCIHLRLTPIWVYPEKFMSADISPAAIEERITSDTAAVFINSIDYYGGRSDIKGIAEVCRRHGVPLLADNAHGAYLAFDGENSHPTALGAAMCADSAHKTLPVLTGGAYLHIGDEKFSPLAKEMMCAFATSSPSYLILDSLDKFNGYITEHPDAVKEVCGKVAALKAQLTAAGVPLYDSDGMRITLDCAAVGSSGFSCADCLRKHGIECEYADGEYCVLLFGTSSGDADFAAVKNVILNNDIFQQTAPAEKLGYINTVQAMPPYEAFYAPRRRVSLNDAVGEICAELYSPCPPGVPLIMPGEVIDEQAAELLRISEKKDIYVVSQS
ncbi:MAG: aminotransferase class V-fold PLP-dependent enzyme [Eubacterium sp.]|nr:aminotransferase class V-fold PLP-dependent enzyme [Eubacterium sp.]